VRALVYILTVLFLMPCLLAGQIALELVALSGGGKVSVVKTQHDCVVKYESQLSDFYLDGELVLKWIRGDSKNVTREYRVVPEEKDKITYEKLCKIKKGDTVVISKLEHRRLTEIVEINLKDLFQKNTIVEMQVYDKTKKEFVTKVHWKEFEAEATHGGKGKRFSIFNASCEHDKWDYLFNLFYDFKGQGW